MSMDHIIEDTVALKPIEISKRTSFEEDIESHLRNYFFQLLDTDCRVCELEKGVQQIDYNLVYKRGVTIINELIGSKREDVERDVYDILYKDSKCYGIKDEEYCEWVLDSLEYRFKKFLYEYIKNLKNVTEKEETKPRLRERNAKKINNYSYK